MRPHTACAACRARRRKCPETQPGQPCASCIRRNIQCSFISAGNGNNEALSSTSPISPASANPSHIESTVYRSRGLRMPSPELCEELVNLYFRYIHDTFHSLFHQPSLLNDVRSGTIPRVILLAIISLSARFSESTFFDGIDPRIRGQPYGQEAARLLDVRDPSVKTIQASVLLGAYVITEGDAVAESLYYAVACRLAMMMDLPNMRVSSRLEQETNIRIWWSLNMIDIWSSNGVRLPRSISPRNDVPYPIEEKLFLELDRESHDPPSPTMNEEFESSLLTQMVKLNAVLFEISQLSRTALGGTATEQLTAFEFDASVDALGRKLEDWYIGLPPQMKDTHENLQHYASLGLGFFFVAVYLGYYHFGQLLYYPYLNKDIRASSSGGDDIIASHAAHYAKRCKQYSTGLCELLYRAYSTPGCEVYYTMVGHVLVVASTVQLFILLFSSSEEEISASRHRLERNFEILKRLQVYWPTLDVCFTRFEEFHNACLDEKESESSFRMDQWMFKFLYEFARPVARRGSGENP